MNINRTIYVDRTYMVGGFAVRITKTADSRRGEAEATWMATTSIPYRDGEDAPTHLTIGAADTAVGAVLALGGSAWDKADVVLHLAPHPNPVYATLTALASGLDSLAWGTVAGWSGKAHPGHPTFEEVTDADLS